LIFLPFYLNKYLPKNNKSIWITYFFTCKYL